MPPDEIERPACSKGWATRCAHGRGKRCRCACGGANHGMVYDTTTPFFARPRPVQLALLVPDVERNVTAGTPAEPATVTPNPVTE